MLAVLLVATPLFTNDPDNNITLADLLSCRKSANLLDLPIEHAFPRQRIVRSRFTPPAQTQIGDFSVTLVEVFIDRANVYRQQTFSYLSNTNIEQLAAAFNSNPQQLNQGLIMPAGILRADVVEQQLVVSCQFSF